MKTKLFALAILLTAVSAKSIAQSTATASTTAELVTPISILKSEDMNFGLIAASATQGTVELGYTDGRTPTGGVSLLAGSSAQKTAVFTVTGEGTSGFSIAIPSSAITLTKSGGVATMTVDNFVADLGASSNLVAGSKEIKVKAILNVPANAIAGTYLNASGLFVTVNYN